MQTRTNQEFFFCCFQIKYVQFSSQLAFLRLLSDRARQNITYHCKDSVAWYDEQLKDVTKSIRMKTSNGVIIDSSSSNKFKPRVLKDNCRVSINDLCFGGEFSPSKIWVKQESKKTDVSQARLHPIVCSGGLIFGKPTRQSKKNAQELILPSVPSVLIHSSHFCDKYSLFLGQNLE